MDFKKEDFPDRGKIFWAVDEDHPDDPFIIFFENDGHQEDSGEWKCLSPMFIDGFDKHAKPASHCIGSLEQDYLLFGDEIKTPLG